MLASLLADDVAQVYCWLDSLRGFEVDSQFFLFKSQISLKYTDQQLNLYLLFIETMFVLRLHIKLNKLLKVYWATPKTKQRISKSPEGMK